MRSTLRWTQWVLFASAFLLLGYCVFVLTNAWFFQKRANAELERLVQVRVSNPTPRTVPPRVLAIGDLIGRIEVPRLGLSVVVIEGSGAPVLRRAAGHIEGTGMPGRAGNIGVAAHRDTYFRPLRNIQLNDLIKLTTARAEYRYRVVSTKVVSPSEVSVLRPDSNEILTLVTCYPFFLVGPAPSRFIVRAERDR